MILHKIEQGTCTCFIIQQFVTTEWSKQVKYFLTWKEKFYLYKWPCSIPIVILQLNQRKQGHPPIRKQNVSNTFQNSFLQPMKCRVQNNKFSTCLLAMKQTRWKFACSLWTSFYYIIWMAIGLKRNWKLQLPPLVISPSVYRPICLRAK